MDFEEEEPDYLTFFKPSPTTAPIYEPEADFIPMPNPPPQPTNANQSFLNRQAREAAQTLVNQMKVRGQLDPLHTSDPFIKRKLIFIILRWANEPLFQQDLKGLVPSTAALNRMDVEELKHLLQEVKFAVALSNSTGFENAIASDAFFKAEELLKTFTPIKADGLGGALSTNMMFQKVLKEAILDTTEAIYTKPKYRGIALGLKLVWDTHLHNSAIEQHVAFMNEPILGRNGERNDTNMQSIIDEMTHLSELASAC